MFLHVLLMKVGPLKKKIDMIVGVICRFEKEFKEFELANPVFECVWIHSKLSLTFTTVDFFVRLKGWEKASSRMLRAVASIEALRGIKRVKAKVKIEQQNPTWSLNGNPVGVIRDAQLRGVHADFIIKDALSNTVVKAKDALDALAWSFALLRHDEVFKTTDNEIGGLP